MATPSAADVRGALARLAALRAQGMTDEAITRAYGTRDLSIERWARLQRGYPLATGATPAAPPATSGPSLLDRTGEVFSTARVGFFGLSAGLLLGVGLVVALLVWAPRMRRG